MLIVCVLVDCGIKIFNFLVDVIVNNLYGLCLLMIYLDDKLFDFDLWVVLLVGFK